MSHARQQIRDQFITDLTGLTTTGTNVSNSRETPQEKDKLPGLNIKTGDEESEDFETGGQPNRLLRRTLPVLVGTPKAIVPTKGVEVLGGECYSCGVNNPLVLKIEQIHNGGKYHSPTTLERMVEKMIRRGQDPQKKFQIICHNCNLLKQKINKYRRSLGLPKITKVSSDLELMI